MTTTPTAALVVRTTTKQAFATAPRVEMLDTPESLQAWADAMNELEGWNKYGVVS